MTILYNQVGKCYYKSGRNLYCSWDMRVLGRSIRQYYLKPLPVIFMKESKAGGIQEKMQDRYGMP